MSRKHNNNTLNANTYLENGDRKLDNSDFRGAFYDYKTCLVSDPNNVPALCNLGLVLMELSLYNEAEKVLNNAVEVCVKCGKIDELNDSILCNLSCVLMEKKDYNTARYMLNKAIYEFDSDHYLVYNNLGYLNYLEENYYLALENYNISIELEEDNPLAFSNRGVLYVDIFHDLENGIRDLQKAKQLGDLDAYNKLLALNRLSKTNN